MMYSIRGMPHSMQRTTTYALTTGGRIVFSAQYSGVQAAQQLGSFVRYIQYNLPRGSAYGTYSFLATLRLGKSSQQRRWTFVVPRAQTVAG